jgi:hypothetical protein
MEAPDDGERAGGSHDHEYGAGESVAHRRRDTIAKVADSWAATPYVAYSCEGSGAKRHAARQLAMLLLAAAAKFSRHRVPASVG